MIEIREKRNTKIIIGFLVAISFVICCALNAMVCAQLKKMKESIYQLEKEAVQNVRPSVDDELDEAKSFVKKTRIKQSQWMKVIFLKVPKNVTWIRIASKNENTMLTGKANSIHEILYFIQECHITAEPIYFKKEKEKGSIEFKLELVGKKE